MGNSRGSSKTDALYKCEYDEALYCLNVMSLDEKVTQELVAAASSDDGSFTSEQLRVMRCQMDDMLNSAGSALSENYVPNDVGAPNSNKAMIEAFKKRTMADMTGIGSAEETVKSYKRNIETLDKYSAFMIQRKTRILDRFFFDPFFFCSQHNHRFFNNFNI